MASKKIDAGNVLSCVVSPAVFTSCNNNHSHIQVTYHVPDVPHAAVGMPAARSLSPYKR